MVFMPACRLQGLSYSPTGQSLAPLLNQAPKL
jgi:hypothetical protein